MSFLKKIFGMFNNPLRENAREAELDPAAKPIPGDTQTVNTITLSTDMTAVYLIDRGRALTFHLPGEKGVLVGLLKDQLTVVTAAEAPPDVKPEETATLESPSLEGRKRLILPLARNQWTLMYHDPSRSLNVIGATDVDFGIAAPGEGDPNRIQKTVECRLFLFNLEKKVVQLRRSKTQLEITFLDR